LNPTSGTFMSANCDEVTASNVFRREEKSDRLRYHVLAASIVFGGLSGAGGKVRLSWYLAKATKPASKHFAAVIALR
jgi:hypothetical protein